VKRLIKNILAKAYTWKLKRTARSSGPRCRANGWVSAANLHLGEDCHFNGMRVYGRGKVTIGSHFHSGKGLTILTEFHDYEGAQLPYDEKVLVRDVEIGRNVWVGLDVCILGGVKIGEGAIIQARSVVVNDIPPLAIAGGHPAKVFKSRDKDHYDALVKTQ
jgi:Acetyltransferase (isoleucine patch superfamily)